MDKKSNIILWLDDKPGEIHQQVKMVENKFCDVVLQTTPMGIINYLEKIKDNKIRISGFIVDVMLSNIESLEDIGLSNIKTPGGFTAGLTFLKYCWWKDFNHLNTPICILTMIQTQRVKDLLDPIEEERLENLKIIEKFAGNWKEELEDWVVEIKTSVENINE